MTWKTPSDEQNWNYLGYLASNLRSVLIPLESRREIVLGVRDIKYLTQGRRFFESAVAGCSSYSEPTRLFSVKESNNVPPAANALRIAVDIYSQIHATPPLSLEDFAGTLQGYAEALDAISNQRLIPDRHKGAAKELTRFLQALIEKATMERFREVKHDWA